MRWYDRLAVAIRLTTGPWKRETEIQIAVESNLNLRYKCTDKSPGYLFKLALSCQFWQVFSCTEVEKVVCGEAASKAAHIGKEARATVYVIRPEGEQCYLPFHSHLSSDKSETRSLPILVVPKDGISTLLLQLHHTPAHSSFADSLALKQLRCRNHASHARIMSYLIYKVPPFNSYQSSPNEENVTELSAGIGSF